MPNNIITAMHLGRPKKGPLKITTFKHQHTVFDSFRKDSTGVPILFVRRPPGQNEGIHEVLDTTCLSIATHWTLARQERLLQSRHLFEDPTMKRGMINLHTTLAHHFLDLPV